MPPRSAVATMTSTNGKTVPKGPRAKKEEPKTEDLSVPTIKTQITNPTKASSGKSFLDALRSGQSKRTAPPPPSAAAAPPPPPPPSAEVNATAALPENGTATPQRPAPAPAVVEAAPPVAETSAPREPSRDAVDTAAAVVVVGGSAAEVPAPPPHNPVTLPESGTGFSWAHDDDYTFVSEYNQQEPEPEPELPVAARYNVQYPQEILDAQPLVAGRIAIKAPLEHQTLTSAATVLEKGHQDLIESRRSFDEFCAQRHRELSEKHAQLMLVERQQNETREALQVERNNLLADQQALAQAQSQLQLQKQQQQQQQQQQQPVSATPPAMNMPPHQQPPQQQTMPPPPPPQQQQQQSVIGYTHSPNSLPWNMGQPDQWRDNVTTTPPYNNQQQPFYPTNNTAFQPYRGKPHYGGNGYGNGMMGRGAGAPPNMGRGGMRPNNHMAQGFNGRPMATGPRGGNVESGANGMFMPRQQPTSYMPPQAQDPYGGWKQ